jgi:hypothetical protein
MTTICSTLRHAVPQAVTLFVPNPWPPRVRCLSLGPLCWTFPVSGVTLCACESASLTEHGVLKVLHAVVWRGSETCPVHRCLIRQCGWPRCVSIHPSVDTGVVQQLFYPLRSPVRSQPVAPSFCTGAPWFFAGRPRQEGDLRPEAQGQPG